jgi:hypothetical protein
LGVRALGPACRLPAGVGEELRRGVLSLLAGRCRGERRWTARGNQPREKK